MSRGYSFCLIQASITILTCLLTVGRFPENFVEVKPSPQQVAWQDLEFGVIIHFSTNTFLDREWGDGTADPKVFSPTHFDAEQWMRAIQAAGAKYVILVVDSGFEGSPLGLLTLIWPLTVQGSFFS